MGWTKPPAPLVPLRTEWQRFVTLDVQLGRLCLCPETTLKRKKPSRGLPASQITSSAGPKRVQLWRFKVITVIHEKVCAANSPGGSHVEATEMLVLQGGDVFANMGASLSEPALACAPWPVPLPCAPAQPVQVPAVPSPCEDVPTKMLK